MEQPLVLILKRNREDQLVLTYQDAINQRISLVEMHEIPVYDSINENQMLSNLALAMQSNGRTVRQLKQSQSTSQNETTFFFSITINAEVKVAQ
jgi:hypothetical protein